MGPRDSFASFRWGTHTVVDERAHLRNIQSSVRGKRRSRGRMAGQVAPPSSRSHSRSSEAPSEVFASGQADGLAPGPASRCGPAQSIEGEGHLRFDKVRWEAKKAKCYVGVVGSGQNTGYPDTKLYTTAECYEVKKNFDQ